MPPTKSKLPPEARKAATHALRELGFSIREVARILGVDQNTVLRYAHQDYDKEWEIFHKTVKNIYLQQDFELVQAAYRRIKEKMPKASFRELVGLVKVLRDINKPPAAVAVQINNLTDKKINDYQI